jgi:hypothetical protein
MRRDDFNCGWIMSGLSNCILMSCRHNLLLLHLLLMATCDFCPKDSECCTFELSVHCCVSDLLAFSFVIIGNWIFDDSNRKVYILMFWLLSQVTKNYILCACGYRKEGIHLIWTYENKLMFFIVRRYSCELLPKLLPTFFCSSYILAHWKSCGVWGQRWGPIYRLNRYGQ